MPTESNSSVSPENTGGHFSARLRRLGRTVVEAVKGVNAERREEGLRAAARGQLGGVSLKVFDLIQSNAALPRENPVCNPDGFNVYYPHVGPPEYGWFTQFQLGRQGTYCKAQGAGPLVTDGIVPALEVTYGSRTVSVDLYSATLSVRMPFRGGVNEAPQVSIYFNQGHDGPDFYDPDGVPLPEGDAKRLAPSASLTLDAKGAIQTVSVGDVGAIDPSGVTTNLRSVMDYLLAQSRATAGMYERIASVTV